jgi:hypothetical protein
MGRERKWEGSEWGGENNVDENGEGVYGEGKYGEGENGEGESGEGRMWKESVEMSNTFFNCLLITTFADCSSKCFRDIM